MFCCYLPVDTKEFHVVSLCQLIDQSNFIKTESFTKKRSSQLFIPFQVCFYIKNISAKSKGKQFFLMIFLPYDIHIDIHITLFFIMRIGKGWHPYQSCHEKRRFDVYFSDPPTQLRNVAPWQTLTDKVKQ